MAPQQPLFSISASKKKSQEPKKAAENCYLLRFFNNSASPNQNYIYIPF